MHGKRPHRQPTHLSQGRESKGGCEGECEGGCEGGCEGECEGGCEGGCEGRSKGGGKGTCCERSRNIAHQLHP